MCILRPYDIITQHDSTIMEIMYICHNHWMSWPNTKSLRDGSWVDIGKKIDFAQSSMKKYLQNISHFIQASMFFSSLSTVDAYIRQWSWLSMVGRQTIIWANYVLLLIKPLGFQWKYNQNLASSTFFITRNNDEILSAKCRPFCSGLKELKFIATLLVTVWFVM